MTPKKSSTPSSLNRDSNDATSSLTKILQKLNKEKEKKEAGAESIKTRCKTCFRETSPNRLCGGHGGGGGAGGSGSTSEEKASLGSGGSLVLKPSADATKELAGMLGTMQDDEALLLTDKDSFNPEIIEYLLDNRLLLVENNRDKMTLTIRLRCEPNVLSQEQRHELTKFIEAILKEWKAFKEDHGIAEDCVNIIRDKEGNILSLQMTLPTPALYDAFIQQLANNLLPTAKAESQAEVKQAPHATPNPFLTKPQPSHNKEKALSQDKVEAKENLRPKEAEETKDDEEKQAIFNPSPLSTKLKPW